MNIIIFRVFVTNVRFTSSQDHKSVFTKYLFTPRNTLCYVALWSDYPVVGIILRRIKDSQVYAVLHDLLSRNENIFEALSKKHSLKLLYIIMYVK